MVLKPNISSKSIINQEWKKFVLSGIIEDDASVRDLIAKSWIRCRQAGVNYLDGYCRKVNTKENTQRLIEEKRQLIEISKLIMNTLFNSVQGYQFIIVLANEDAIVLDTIGNEDILELTPTLNFLPGADWSEESVGTNAIGTSLAINEPVQVVGSEHYCRKHHEWTCSSAPIHNSIGKVIGCLNISGIAGCEDSHHLGMVSAAVKAIENQLQKDETRAELAVAHEQLTTVMSTISDGILSIDKNFIITHANSAFAKMVGLFPSDVIGKPYTEILGNSDHINRVIESGKSFLEEEMVIDTPKKQIHCTIKANPIKDLSYQVAGTVITFREIKQVHQIVNAMVGAQARFRFCDIIGESEEIQQIIRKAKIVAKSTSTVLLLGESGTGKEVFSQAIHNSSNRFDGPFIAVNCAAIPRDLIQSELFGYTDGAFTGAKRGGRPGKFELADDGTLLLDEIGDMPLDLQVNLLRVLEEKNVVRIGGEKHIPINVRVIAATNRNLKDAVEKGTFREDLYYRLNVVTLNIPPLRERGGDVNIFIEYFIKKMSLKMGKEILKVDPSVIEILQQYQWPGNIRELENILEYAITMVEGDVLIKSNLPSYFSKLGNKKIEKEETIIPLADLESIEIAKAVKKFEGNISKAAKVLGIARNTLYEKIKKYNIIPMHKSFEE